MLKRNTEKEKLRRSIQMSKLNSTFRKQKNCMNCADLFSAGIGQIYCSKKCKREYQIFKSYGITQAEYEVLAVHQAGHCAICDRVVPLVIDHCHTDGHVRGLLCKMCNMALRFFDDKDFFTKALNYINETKKPF